MQTLTFPPPATAPDRATEHPALRRFDVHEYRRLVGVDSPVEGRRTELIDGLIYAMAPFSPRHIAVVNRFTAAFARIAGDDARVSVQNSVRLSDGTEAEPDLVLLRRDASEDRVPIPEDVLLVVEIAVTTEAFDRNVKLLRYAQTGIAEAWLVLPEKRTVETFRQPGPEGYTETALYTEADTIAVLGASVVFPPESA